MFFIMIGIRGANEPIYSRASRARLEKKARTSSSSSPSLKKAHIVNEPEPELRLSSSSRLASLNELSVYIFFINILNIYYLY
ncbi:hypothetical protein HanHA300_Chr00c0109g0710971 [Helianthus annuus]|nr:hypothetical protein HanHA89_Chr11g0410921 [Helianthus annuus]KAJ0638490.1 hypothetical protein HanHA300_Chr00c0109g0710971 [Helianthus annuus]KAJ0684206.1 hypothetical protein HanLR1_Chr11g0388611 [Helianthus annuus]